MTISERTVDDMRAAVEAISLDPESFDMLMWAINSPCQSTMCFAGHLAYMRGFTPVLNIGSWCRDGLFRGMMEVPIGPVRYSQLGLDGGTRTCECEMVIYELMQKEFGLSYEQQELLFYAENWPKELQIRYELGDRVGALREVVELFIEEYGPKRKAHSAPNLELTEVSV